MFNRKIYFAKRGKKSERLASVLMAAPDKESANKIRMIFGEKQI